MEEMLEERTAGVKEDIRALKQSILQYKERIGESSRELESEEQEDWKLREELQNRAKALREALHSAKRKRKDLQEVL